MRVQQGPDPVPWTCHQQRQSTCGSRENHSCSQNADPTKHDISSEILGMVNQLGPFSPRLAELNQPLRELLSTNRAWSWGPAQDEAFAKLKLELSADTVLALYDPQAATKVSASNYGTPAARWNQVETSHICFSYSDRN